ASQKFTKTDLAKFEHSWEQLPHLVSLGAEKNFREFMVRLAERPRTPDHAYFERLVAKAILFRAGEKIVSAKKFGGYRAQIVTYSIAKLCHATGHRLDPGRIWRSQSISEATAEALADISTFVHDVIVHPLGRVRNIGEWCKKVDCWAKIRELDWKVPSVLRKELLDISAARAGSEPLDMGLSTHTQQEKERIDRAAAVPAEVWLSVSHWAKQTGNL